MLKFEDPKLYSVSSSASGFIDRQKNLFSILESAEKDKDKKYGAVSSAVKSISGQSKVAGTKKNKINTKQFVGQESIFKKPAFRPPKSHRRPSIPDYQLNPQKWTKYSLADVTQDDMSDQRNTATAFSFLKELEMRKSNKEQSHENIDFDNTKIIFNRVLKCDQQSLEDHPSSSDTSKPTKCFSRSKLILPEYVVGQKKASKSKRTVRANSSTNDPTQKSVKLDHLLDEEND